MRKAAESNFTYSILSVFLLVVLFPFGLLAQPLSGILPKYDAYVYQPTINFEWNSLTGAVDYTVVLANDPAFTVNVIQSPPQTGTSWTTDPIAFGTWYWRVIGSDGAQTMEGNIGKVTYYLPAEEPTLSLWLKADEGLILDASNNVETWIDQSSASLQFNQPTSTKRPSMNPISFGGLPSLVFSGGQWLNGGDVLDLESDPRSIYIIGKFGGDNQCFFSKTIAALASNRYGIQRQSNQTQFTYQEVAESHINSSSNSNNFGLYNCQINRQLSQNKFLLNGNVLGSNTISSSYNMNSTYRFLIGAYNNASDNGEQRFLNGNISEVIFIDTENSEDRANVENYIKYKYSNFNLGADILNQNDFCNQTIVAPSGFNNILWSTGATTTSIALDQSGNYWVRGTDLLGFVWYDTILVTYPTIPSPTNTEICAGQSNTWNADMGPGFSYQWSTGETTPSIDISAPGTYNVTVFDSFGCSKNSGNYVFSIDNYPNTASLGLDTSMCLGNTIELQVGALETFNYFWNGDVSPDQPGSFVPNTTGEYTLESINNNGCVARDTILVTISGIAPVANFLVDNFCFQDALQCTDVSTAEDSDPLATWSWDFGDGNQSSDQNPTHVYDSPGYYFIELYVESVGGCGENLFVPVEIRSLPFADLSYEGNCDNAGTQFNDNSVEGEGTINSWFWNFGQPGGTGSNTSILQSPSKDYGTPGDYTVYFQVTDAYGCQDDTTFVLSILQAPQTVFTADDACENVNVPLTNTSTIGSPYVIQSQLWDFGDGTFSILPVPTKSFSNFGYHTITLTTTADNGCTDIEQVQILVHSTPVPMFSVGPACVGTYTELNDVSTVTTGWIGGSNWEIDLTENIQGSTAYYQFQTEGSHNVELTTTSNFGCSASGMFIFDVGPELSADWDSYPLTIVTGVPVQFDYTGTGSEYWDWNMGNGEHVYFTDHTYTYGELWADSTLDISLYTSNSEGCEDTLTRTFTVERAYFDLEVQKILLNEVDGYMNVGVQLHNNGTSLIDSVEVELVFSSGLMLKETYASVLQSDQTEIMVFTSLPSSFVSVQNGEPDWICAEGSPYTMLNLTETDQENNKVCLNRENEEPVIIGPYPNPASESFDLELFITSESTIDLKLIDAKGRLVLLLADGYTYSQGLYEFHVPLLSIQSGVYFLEMVNGDSRTLKKLMVE